MAAAVDDLEIAPLAERDIGAAAESLARAFRDNPLNRAVVRGGPDRRLRANRHGMLSLLPVARQHGFVRVARRRGSVVGVLVATLPRGYPLPPPPLARRLRTLLGQGLGVAARWGQVFDALDAEHPPSPHWYLGTLGVDPGAQRTGVGGALLRDWLSHVDADPLGAYLETDRSRNVAFYEAAGFQVEGDLTVLGARVWRMSRPRGAPAPTAAKD